MTTLPVDLPAEALALITGFSARFVGLLDEAGYPPGVNNRMDAVADHFGVSPQTARKWLKGVALPNPLTLCQITERFGVSLDWLLAGRSSAVDDLVPVPRYRLEDARRARFVRTGELWIEPNEPIFRAALASRAYIKNWCSMRDPGFELDDTILVDTADLRLAEDGIFLLRSGTLVVWRRILVSVIDGSLIISSSSATAHKERVTLSPADIDWNTTGSLDAEPSEGRLLVVARVLAIYKNLAAHACRII